MAEARGYSPPFGDRYVESTTSPAVRAAVEAFGRGRSSLYDTHPHHTALTTDVVPEQPAEDRGRAHLRSLCTSTFGGELDFDAARSAHLGLCGKASP